MSKMLQSTVEKILHSNEIWISHPTGKLHDIPAITTSCKENSFCEKMSHCDKCICSKCYAQNSLNYEEGARVHYRRNGELLSNPLPDYYIPRLYSDVCRFDTHGEWMNVVHALNEIRIALANPQTDFTPWSKRVDILTKVVNMGVKQPDNYHVRISSPFLNVTLPQSVKESFAKRGWTVAYFTVCSLDFLLEKYGLEYLREHGDEIITCGGRDCRGCMKCYGKHDHYDDVVELLKQDVHRALKLGIKIG